LREEFIRILIANGLYKKAVLNIMTLGEASSEKTARRAVWLCKCGNCYDGQEYFTDRLGTDPENGFLRLTLAGIEAELGRFEIAGYLLDHPRTEWSEQLKSGVDKLKAKIHDLNGYL
jgi:hypothetical protein